MLLESILLVALGGIMALLLTQLFFARFKNLPAILSALTSAVVFVLGSVLLKTVLSGPPISYAIPLSGPFQPSFYADPLSATMLVLAALLWFVVSIYAPKYISHEAKPALFYFSTAAVFFAVLGVFLAGDLFSMLLFFELMTVASFFWVVHKWNKQAVKAGYFYLFFSIIGGLLIALGIVLMGSAVGTLPAIGAGPVMPLNPVRFNWSVLLFITGFGIKAGMVPLHLWLPRTHAVAPTPGSALLSGLLIKIGAYGLIRVMAFAGWGQASTATVWVGTLLAGLGTLTMLVGVIAALLQSDAKRLLAYHSVSQMGYIIMGLGLAFFLGQSGALCFLGSVYHIINHALFKSALFLGVGIIYMNTRQTNLYKMGGLWRRFPVVAVLMLVAVLGIVGAPGLNGYISKTLLHHGVDVAIANAVPYAGVLGNIFNIVGVGTAASFAKFYYLMFLKKPIESESKDAMLKTEHLMVPSSTKSPSKKRLNKGLFAMYTAIGLLDLIMLAIGLMPNLFLNNIAVPVAKTLGMLDFSVTSFPVSFWTVKDIFGIFVTLAIGMLVCWGGLKSGLFHWKAPAWLTIEGLATLAYRGLSFVTRKAIKGYNVLLTGLAGRGRKLQTQLSSALNKFDKNRTYTVEKTVFAGTSADIAIVAFVLALLIAGFTLVKLKFGFIF